MRWSVEIDKASLEERNLSDLLSHIGFTLFTGENGYEFTSQEIDGCCDASEVYEIAKKLRSSFCGIAEIDNKFSLGSVVEHQGNNTLRHTFMELKPATFNMRGGELNVTLSPPPNLTQEELKSWHSVRNEKSYQEKLKGQLARFAPAHRSIDAEKVLELLSIESPRGEHLYKIYELIESNYSNKQTFHDTFSITWQQFNRFRDAVHNPSVNGDWARHAIPDVTRTNNPMSVSEATAFIKNIADSWLSSLV